jgi:hypothetical protein
VHAGLLQRLGERASLRIGTSFRRLDYDNVPGLYNDDRDRDILTGALQFSYELGGGYQWFSQAAVDQRRYRLAFDDNGYHRDSAGYRLQTGLRWRQGDTRGDAYIGHMGQDYDAGNLSDVSALDLGASLSWQATPATVLRIAAERSIEETTLAWASSYLWTTLSAGVTHKLQPKLSITASLGAMESDYQGLVREDDFLTAALGAKYQLTRNGFLSASYRFLERDSNDATADFDRNQLALLVGWQF